MVVGAAVARNCCWSGRRADLQGSRRAPGWRQLLHWLGWRRRCWWHPQRGSPRHRRQKTRSHRQGQGPMQARGGAAALAAPGTRPPRPRQCPRQVLAGAPAAPAPAQAAGGSSDQARQPGRAQGCPHEPPWPRQADTHATMPTWPGPSVSTNGVGRQRSTGRRSRPAWLPGGGATPSTQSRPAPRRR